VNEQQRGVPIREATPPPDWVRPHLSPAQLDLNPGLLWMLLIYQWRGRHPSRTSVAQRLYVYTLGRKKKEWDPTFAELAADLDLSERTVEPALAELEADGWIVVTRLHRRNIYQLAWPVRDVLAPPTPEVPLCGAPTSKGGRCTKRAGRGTETPGVGPCKQHREEPGPEPLPLKLPPAGPQPLQSDQPAQDDHSTATVAEFDRNGCGVRPQPLRPDTATIAVPYVGTFGSLDVRTSGLLSEGQPYVGDAHAREAPPAQPKNHSFAARSLISSLRRYRDAPGWVKSRHLAPMAAAALNAGFGRDAITHYARLTIDEAAYLDHQHIPEFRSALNRLSRDVHLGTVCRTCGRPPDCRCTTTAADDRPWSWTAQDQADLDAAIAYLATPTTPDTGTA